MYEQTLNLNHNEMAAKINVETGEIKQVAKRGNNIPSSKKFHNPDMFVKVYDKADAFLLGILTPLEYRVVSIMKSKSKMNTNSLEPLSDDTSITELAKELSVHRNSVNKIIDKLRGLGVFATFTVTNQYRQEITSWILNPYISFRGKMLSTEIIHLFDDTIIAKVCKD